MAEPKTADSTVSLTVMHVSASASGWPGTWGSGRGRSAADQDGGGGDHRGPRKPELFLEVAWKGAKLEQNLYVTVSVQLRPHVPGVRAGARRPTTPAGAQAAIPQEQVRASLPQNPCFYFIFF